MATSSKHPQLSTPDRPTPTTPTTSHAAINEKRLLRKLDYKLLPAVSTLYLLSFLDRSNVANARVEGLAADLRITGDQYLTGLSLFFVGYILFEVPWNLVLRRTSPKFWLPTVTLVWGVVAALTGVCGGLRGFLAVRFFLGVAEGALFPGVLFYLSIWYRRQERQYRIALFFSAASLAGAFGGILAFGIAHMDGVGGLAGWRWIFIIEGLATVVAAIGAYYYVSSWPAYSRFLNEDEKEYVVRRIEADKDMTATTEVFQWPDVIDAFRDVKVWLYCLACHAISLPLYTYSFFLPTIIKDLGYTAAQAQLLTVPPYALATILTFLVASISERRKKRAPFIIAATICAIIGYCILLGNNSTTTIIDPKTHMASIHVKRPGISYVGTFFAAAGIYPTIALVFSWLAVNVSGATKRATAGAMQIAIGNAGAIIGTQIYRTNNAPSYTVGNGVTLAYLVLNILVCSVLWVVLNRENKRREALLAEGKESEELRGDEDVRWRFTT